MIIYRLLACVALGFVQPQMANDDSGEVSEPITFGSAEAARHRIDQTEGANPDTWANRKRRTRIEPDVWFARDERVCGKPCILAGVLNDQQIISHDRMSAEGDVAWRAFADRSAPRLLPLSIRINHRNRGDWHGEESLSCSANGVKVRFRRRIEDTQIA